MTPPRRLFIVAVAAGVLPTLRGALAQAGSMMPRIALVFSTIPLSEMTGAEPAHPWARAFVRQLRESGLVEGQNIVIERRSAEDRRDRLPVLMDELVRLDVAVIVTTGPAVAAAQRATNRIAIVAVLPGLGEPDSGLVGSLGRPGGNLTGIGTHSFEIYGKELQLLKEAVPSIARVAVIDQRPSTSPATRSRRSVLDAAARELRLQLLWLDVDTPQDLDDAFAAIVRERPDALYVVGTLVTYGQRQRIADFARTQRLPSAGFPELGMLLSYESDADEEFRRAAVYVKKILDGARPGDLPIEQSTKFKLIINLKAARALGLTLPQTLLLRADEVIE